MNQRTESKSTLRKKMRDRLNALEPSVIRSASKAICQHFLTHPSHRNTATPTIAIFSAHGPEVNLSDLHHDFQKARLLYPLCHSEGKLSFHHVSDPSELSPGTLGILEPDPNKHPKVKLQEIDLFLCPGIAFGRDGSRLGQGGGFYDRALVQRSKSAITMGVGLEIQRIDTVPHAVHDIAMDFLLTENGCFATTT